ncbi:hypothetical protein CJU89_1172 [Yarrowia sp. B02]|nr:hypothetical protein CJU89_1172 [Yarrowia sp. B02]
MIRGIGAMKRIPSGLSRDTRHHHVTHASFSIFSRFLHEGTTLKQTSVDASAVKDFKDVVNELVVMTSRGKHDVRGGKHKAKKATGNIKDMHMKMNDLDSESVEKEKEIGSSKDTIRSAVPTAIQQLMASANMTARAKPSSPAKPVSTSPTATLKSHVETLCITQSPDVLISSHIQLIESNYFPGAQITLNHILERAQTEEGIYETLQRSLITLCEQKRLPLFRNLMKANPVVDPKRHILPFLLETGVKMGKEQGHATSLSEIVASSKRDGSNKISKIGHEKLSWQLKGLFYDRPHDLLHLLETNPEMTQLVSSYVIVFSTLLISSAYVERQSHLWEKIFLQLSHKQPLEWYISHERLLRDLSANFWGNVISRKHSPTLRDLRLKIRKLPPSQAVWIEATLMANELTHANALVEAMLNEGFSATEEVAQHLVRLFTRDMDPGEALDVIDDLHKQYGTYISLHTTFFSHWCRTRNSVAVMSMIKVLEGRNQMTKEFYIQAFQRLLKNGDFKKALYLADMMSRDTEISSQLTAGEFLSAALYRGRQSVFPKNTKYDISDLMTEGLRYHLHVERFASYISKFNESREEPTTRLPIHVILRYLNELHKRGLYASVAWYQYNLEMMQVCALTEPEVELLMRGLARLFSKEQYISRDFDLDFSDIIAESQAVVEKINDRMKNGKGLVEEVDGPIYESDTAFSDDSGTADKPAEKTRATSAPSYNQVFSSPYFQFETVKWGAIKSPKDPGSGVRILSMLSKQSKSYIRPYIVADAIQHVATKIYISTPPSYRRLRSQTGFNMIGFLEECESQWKGRLKWNK